MNPKTRELTIEQLCAIKSQIDLSNRSYTSQQQWENSKKAVYLLKLLLNQTENKHKIHLYVDNWDTFNIDSEISINNSHYIAGEPGIEELTAIYNYIGHYKKPELMYDLNEAKKENEGEQLIKEARKRSNKEDAMFFHELLYHDNITELGAPTTYKDISSTSKNRIKNQKVKVVFQSLPNPPLNNDRVKIDL